ncbi:hypothetical protein PanWU01x14_261410, partial [Parasponia andersonii]
MEDSFYVYSGASRPWYNRVLFQRKNATSPSQSQSSLQPIIAPECAKLTKMC